MKVYHHINDFKRLSHAVVTSGTFDGVHLGHLKILNRLTQIAKQENGESVVITYWPHPRTVLQPQTESPQVLNTTEEKIELLAQAGIQHLLILPFTKEFSALSSEDFIQKILIEVIGTKTLVIGYDHRFGRNREGSFESLKENAPQYGFRIEEISRQDIDEQAVSSTAVRRALLNGELGIANKLLGYTYKLEGRVIKGRQLGRTIGYPTANIQTHSKDKLVPLDGVYAVQVLVQGQCFGGMLNIGNNPTVAGATRSIEVHIFDFSREIYDQSIEIIFLSYLRKEEKFNSLDDLIAQLRLDEINSKRILATL